MLDKLVFEHSTSELRLRELMSISPNIIDLINENMKLKDALNTLKSCYRSDVIN